MAQITTISKRFARFGSHRIRFSEKIENQTKSLLNNGVFDSHMIFDKIDSDQSSVALHNIASQNNAASRTNADYKVKSSMWGDETTDEKQKVEKMPRNGHCAVCYFQKQADIKEKRPKRQ